MEDELNPAPTDASPETAPTDASPEDSGDAAQSRDDAAVEIPTVDIGGKQVPIDTIIRQREQVRQIEPMAQRIKELESETQYWRSQQQSTPQQAQQPAYDMPTIEQAEAEILRDDLADPALKAYVLANRVQRNQGNLAQMQMGVTRNSTSFRGIYENNPSLILGNEKYNPEFAEAFEKNMGELGMHADQLLQLPEQQFRFITEKALKAAKLDSGVAKTEWEAELERRNASGNAQELVSHGSGAGGSAPDAASAASSTLDSVAERMKAEWRKRERR